jgi:hypothetical protein
MQKRSKARALGEERKLKSPPSAADLGNPGQRARSSCNSPAGPSSLLLQGTYTSFTSCSLLMTVDWGRGARL